MEDRICSVEGCERRVRCRGWCSTHYERWRLHGNVDWQSPKTRRGTVQATFERLIAIETDEHVLWPHSTKNGYGQAWLNGIRQHTHRAALLRFQPMVSPDSIACHVPGIGCNRRCINPRHLYWGTKSTNARDSGIDGTKIRGERHPWAKLSEVQVREIRSARGTKREVAEQFGVSIATIQGVVARRSWTWLS